MTDKSESQSDSRSGTHHHDTGYKELFSYPEMVQALIEGFLPQELSQRVDFETLTPQPGSYVTPLFDERIEDVVWSMEIDCAGTRQPLYLVSRKTPVV